MDLSIILERSELFGATQSTQEQLGLAYMDLLSLVSDIAVHFHKATHGMHSASVSIDLFHTFGQNIESFRSRRARIVEEMWHNQLAAEFSEHDEGSDSRLDTLSTWLTRICFSRRDPDSSSMAHTCRQNSCCCDKRSYAHRQLS